jgi:replicative DNA helicase
LNEPVRKNLRPVKDMLTGSFNEIQALFDRKQRITGVPSGFVDLDRVTLGFQPGDLIIIAGRPAMGKSSFAVNIAENAAIKNKVTVGLFSLEMSAQQLMLRLLGSQSEVALHKLRSGFLSNEDWPRLTAGGGLLRNAPIWIDDTAAPTVLELRAKCRRLKAEANLGLVVIDYLQMIQAIGRIENRVQEVSQITRALKAMAKEMEVPVIALSQLSRGVEQRGAGDKRPQLSDLRDSGCLTADARVLRADTNAEVSLGDLIRSGEEDIPVWSIDESYRVVQSTMTRVFPSGTKDVFEMRLASGRSIKASANHPFLTLDGWRRLDQLAAGDRLAVPRRVPDPLEISDRSEAELAYCGSTFYKHSPSRERLMQVARVVADPELHLLAESDLFWDAIVAIAPLGAQPVFDATVPGTHNFIANGIVTHNSIEQDADLVMFVYREEYYKPDDPSLAGKAEIIVGKHRNGQTGTVKLTFIREQTKFVDHAVVMPDETQPGY